MSMYPKYQVMARFQNDRGVWIEQYMGVPHHDKRTADMDRDYHERVNGLQSWIEEVMA